jgi:drug/metabolite transporter (DMT)-like permease
MLTAIIWGVGFVAQRAGMEHIGPYTFNGLRFLLGAGMLVPLMLVLKPAAKEAAAQAHTVGPMGFLWGAGLAGTLLFLGASFQQVGLVYTTAGKAGFITGLYVVIVPILGLVWRRHTDTGTWIGAILAAAGLYFLSVTEQFTISWGDFLELIGAFFWAGHVLLLGWFSSKTDPIRLACFQFLICAVLSLIVAVIFEVITLERIRMAALPIFFGGAVSVGIGYTLQVVAQRHAHPAHAAIILSLEAVFAALGGWWLLQETLTTRALAGCMLMLTGMLLSQMWEYGVYRWQTRRVRSQTPTIE